MTTAAITPSQFFQGLLSVAKGDISKDVIGPAISFLQTAQKAPPVDTVQGQVAIVAAAGQVLPSIVANVASDVPGFVQTEQAAIFGMFAAELSALQTKLAPPAAAASAK